MEPFRKSPHVTLCQCQLLSPHVVDNTLATLWLVYFFASFSYGGDWSSQTALIVWYYCFLIIVGSYHSSRLCASPFRRRRVQSFKLNVLYVNCTERTERLSLAISLHTLQSVI